jgi:RND family efflux transporter MFP subunit
LSQRKAASAQKDMFSIKSPIEGVVDAINIKVGDAISPGNPNAGIHVTSHDKLKAVASLGENYIGKVKENDNTLLVFRDLNDSIKTHLSYVAQSVDVISRAFNVEVKLGSNSKLRPNMSCIMKIANYQNKKALVVPVAAIQKTAEGEMVYVANGEVAKSVIIQTGRNSNGNVEVLGGLKEGDKVIVAGYEDLENGERISVK